MRKDIGAAAGLGRNSRICCEPIQEKGVEEESQDRTLDAEHAENTEKHVTENSDTLEDNNDQVSDTELFIKSEMAALAN